MLAKETYSRNQLFVPILATLEMMLDEELSASLSKTDAGRDMYVIIQLYFFPSDRSEPV